MTARELRDAYGSTAAAWAAGPQRAYRRLSEALIAACPVPLGGRLALDLGAGTGAASRVCTDAGARVVALDAAVGMLAHRRRFRPPAAAGDAGRLPFPDGVFEVLVAAFVLNHLSDAEGALAEAVRVTRPGGRLLAATFHRGWTHPAKDAVEEALASFGWRKPAWYADLKERTAPALGTPEAFAEAAAGAGWAEVRIIDTTVDTGLRTAADLAAWRLGMAQTAPFVAGLADTARARLRAEAERRIADRTAEPLRPRVLLCQGRSPG